MCNQTVSLIAAELERQGISTVILLLLREVGEAVRPPRALWVPFPHGYPLGRPDDPPAGPLPGPALFDWSAPTTPDLRAVPTSPPPSVPPAPAPFGGHGSPEGAAQVGVAQQRERPVAPGDAAVRRKPRRHDERAGEATRLGREG